MADGRNLVIIVDDDQAVREALQFAYGWRGCVFMCIVVGRPFWPIPI